MSTSSCSNFKSAAYIDQRGFILRSGKMQNRRRLQYTFSHLPCCWSRCKYLRLDLLGAGLLSPFIIFDCAKTCFENVFRLTGSAIDEILYEKLTFLAWRFSLLVNGYKCPEMGSGWKWIFCWMRKQLLKSPMALQNLCGIVARVGQKLTGLLSPAIILRGSPMGHTADNFE